MAPMASPVHTPLSPEVPGGLRQHRTRVRRWGVLAGLAIPGVLGVVATALLRGSETGWRGIPGFALAVMAVPTLPLAGIPAAGGSTRWTVAIVTSALLWLLVAVTATRRAALRVPTGWREWRREWLPLAAGVWAGALVALGVAGVAMSVGWI
jgi:hypothetical protein